MSYIKINEKKRRLSVNLMVTTTMQGSAMSPKSLLVHCC